MTSALQEQRQDQTGMTVRVDAIAGRDDVERIEAVVQVPAAFQYVIPARKKVGNDWVQDNKVGITSDGYDYLNRWLGVSFFLPEMVPDQDGTLARNPVHRKDYIYCRMGGVWWNEAGQLVAMTEDLEVDFGFIYQNARLEGFESEVLLNNDKQPIFDEIGNPKIVLKNAADEKKALKALHQLRTMGMRYTQTVLRTRILKVALGVKSLPIPDGVPKPFNLRVVGFRDKMTPQERQSEAEASLGRLYSGVRPATTPTMTHADMVAIERDTAEDEAAATVAVATATATEEQVGIVMTDDEKAAAIAREWAEAGQPEG